jgi:hypothetical protein
MTLHDRLSQMVDAALPGTLVPVSSLRELLDHHQSETRYADPGLSLEEVAERCAARGNRTKPVGTPTVRKWIRTGLRGVRLKAFPWGMSYRVTEQALASFILALQGGRGDAGDQRKPTSPLFLLARWRTRSRSRAHAIPGWEPEAACLERGAPDYLKRKLTDQGTNARTA